MAKKNDELLKKLLATFRIEADEHLAAMTSGLLALEKMPPLAEAAGIIETVFREAHSLKGAARAVNLAPIESLCQALESVFAALKAGRLAASLPLLDLLHQSVDALGGLLGAESDASQALPAPVAALIRQLELAADGTLPAPDILSARHAAPAAEKPAAAIPAADSPAHAPPSAPVAAPGTVRIATAKLDTVMRQVEELLSPRLAARQRALELGAATAAVAARKKMRAQIQPVLRRIERSAARSGTANGMLQGQKELLKLFEYLDGEQLFITAIESQLAKLNKAAARDHRTLAGMSDSLLQDVKEMQLLPFASLLDILPRLARDLAREQGKEIALALHGSEIEIDRRILEELKDPLIHLLRNSVDHGIETPAARAACGKPQQGTVTVTVSQPDSGKVEVRVADNGAGIDTARVKAAALKMGIISAAEAEESGEHETLALVFQSGISTSPIITDVSGRGLGLAIVREKVERLGGSIMLESQHGAGSAFHLVLPLTLATFRGVLVRAGGQLCVIPASGVERVALVPGQEIRTVENRETIPLDGQAVALANLGDVLEMPRTAASEEPARIPVIVLGQDKARVAFRVDEITGEQEILLKPLGPQLARVRNVAGATVLGTGQVVPVLNVADLLKSAVRRSAAPLASAAAARTETGTGGQHSILVAEDSITSRSLLKNILESAGYAVTTAVDGLDAYTALKTGSFDLIVSDVEMPRMDGFGLTAKVRGDKQLAALPVVLVTALETREHRERGIDAGANAYIVKSSFDQSNLLETIRRLL